MQRRDERLSLYRYGENEHLRFSGGCYYYFGSVEDGLREGRGRTAMMDGGTAFEGGYLHDQRDGFGTYYYKSGSFAMPAIGRKTAGTVWASRLRPATAPATLAFGIRTAVGPGEPC